MCCKSRLLVTRPMSPYNNQLTDVPKLRAYYETTINQGNYNGIREEK